MGPDRPKTQQRANSRPRAVASLALLAVVTVTAVAGEPAAPPDEASQRARAWNCEDGRFLVSRLRNEDLWLFLPGETVRLDPEPAASGAKYADGTVSFWSKGDAAVLDTPQGRIGCMLDHEASVWEDAKLRGADFRAVGNEPGWHLELFSGQPSLLVSDYGQRQLRFPAHGPLPLEPGPGSLFTGRAQGMEIVVLVTPGPCRDTMVDREYESRVRVLAGDEVLSGCGRALH